MPRRGRSPSPMARGRSPSPVAQRRPMHTAPAPARSQVPAHAPPPPQPPMMAQPQQPGMFAQMATTAAGVAVGSAIGHTMGHALTGGFGGGSEPAAQEQEAVSQGAPEPLTRPAMMGACNFEMRQFLECAQTQHDLSLCDGFNEVLKQCKQSNGLI